MPPSPDFVFFGTDEFSVAVLEELAAEHLIPSLIVAPPDRPKGRHLKLTPPPIKIWAKRHDIEILQPEKLSPEFASQLLKINCELFVVASYGKIIPKEILDIPEHGALNVHPSLLPKYRGASPLQSQILNDEKEVGVTIILMDEQMDHGPILIQEKLHEGVMPIPAPVLSHILASIGGRILAKVIPLYLEETVKPVSQSEDKVTFTAKIKKEDGFLDLNDDKRKNYLKFLAYQGWPGTYFFAGKGDPLEQGGDEASRKTRVIIKEAHFSNSEFVITKVLPEGGHEMSYEDFLRGQ